MIIACAALYLYPEDSCAELACVATHPDYRGRNCGERILAEVLKRAKEANINTLFVLTTVTAHWFLDQGFKPASVDALPRGKQELYNFQRKSKVFTLDVS
jgi:amino-acid N-acetyltransferase